MIRDWNNETNCLDIFFEEFETVVHQGVTSATPERGIRYVEPPTFIRLPYGSLHLAECAHEYLRALIDFDGKLWTCAVCRHCEHIAPPDWAQS